MIVGNEIILVEKLVSATPGAIGKKIGAVVQVFVAEHMGYHFEPDQFASELTLWLKLSLRLYIREREIDFNATEGKFKL